LIHRYGSKTKAAGNGAKQGNEEGREGNDKGDISNSLMPITTLIQQLPGIRHWLIEVLELRVCRICSFEAVLSRKPWCKPQSQRNSLQHIVVSH
jgi:hypothetical protein